MPRFLHKQRLIRLLAGWCGLLLYVAVFTPMGMSGLALLGMIDPDHHVVLSPSADGLRLVLHHEGNCAKHQHRLVARTLTLFAQPAHNADPDHVLQFSSAPSLTRDAQALVSAPNQAAPIGLVAGVLVVSDADRWVEFIPPPRPPPDIGGNLLNVRSTVFLI